MLRHYIYYVMLIFQYERVSQFSAAISQPKQLSKCFSVLSLLFIY